MTLSATDIQQRTGFTIEPQPGIISQGIAPPILRGAAIGARAYNSASLTVASSTITAVTLDSERWDTDSCHSTSANTSRLTCNTAGKYVISGNIAFDANTSGTFRDIGIRLNGSTIIAYNRASPNSGTPNIIATTIWDLVAGDYVEMIAQQDSGASRTLAAQADFTPEFSMVLIGS